MLDPAIGEFVLSDPGVSFFIFCQLSFSINAISFCLDAHQEEGEDLLVERGLRSSVG